MAPLQEDAVLCWPVSLLIARTSGQSRPEGGPGLTRGPPRPPDQALGSLTPAQAALLARAWRQPEPGPPWQGDATLGLAELAAGPAGTAGQALLAQLAGAAPLDPAVWGQVWVPALLQTAPAARQAAQACVLQAHGVLLALGSGQLARSGLLHLAVLAYHAALQEAAAQGPDAAEPASAAQLVTTCTAAAAAPLLQLLLDDTGERLAPAQQVLALSPRELHSAHAALADLAAWALGQPMQPRLYPAPAGPLGGLPFCADILPEVGPMCWHGRLCLQAACGLSSALCCAAEAVHAASPEQQPL